MNLSGLPPPVTPWPPLRVGRTRPWIKFRDLALTLAAWAVLAWLLRDPLYLIYDFLRHPIFEITSALPPDLVRIWSVMRILVAISAVLALGLLLWAVKERHRLRSRKPLTAPRALSIAEQAAWFRADVNMVTEARNFKVTAIHFHEDGSIAAREGPDAAGQVPTTSAFPE